MALHKGFAISAPTVSRLDKITTIRDGNECDPSGRASTDDPTIPASDCCDLRRDRRGL